MLLFYLNVVILGHSHLFPIIDLGMEPLEQSSIQNARYYSNDRKQFSQHRDGNMDEQLKRLELFEFNRLYFNLMNCITATANITPLSLIYQRS